MIEDRIRLAVEADVPAIVRLGCAFHATSVYAQLIETTPEAMAALATTLIQGADSDIYVSERLDDGIVGMLGLAAYVHPLSQQRMASELFWWVMLGHRGSRGIRLLKAAEAWAVAHGAAFLQMIAPDGRVAEIYDRLGYTMVETTYQKRLGPRRVSLTDQECAP